MSGSRPDAFCGDAQGGGIAFSAFLDRIGRAVRAPRVVLMGEPELLEIDVRAVSASALFTLGAPGRPWRWRRSGCGAPASWPRRRATEPEQIALQVIRAGGDVVQEPTVGRAGEQGPVRRRNQRRAPCRRNEVRRSTRPRTSHRCRQPGSRSPLWLPARTCATRWFLPSPHFRGPAGRRATFGAASISWLAQALRLGRTLSLCLLRGNIERGCARPSAGRSARPARARCAQATASPIAPAPCLALDPCSGPGPGAMAVGAQRARARASSTPADLGRRTCGLYSGALPGATRRAWRRRCRPSPVSRPGGFGLRGKELRANKLRGLRRVGGSPPCWRRRLGRMAGQDLAGPPARRRLATAFKRQLDLAV